jgi:hypothetical protein
MKSKTLGYGLKIASESWDDAMSLLIRAQSGTERQP